MEPVRCVVPNCNSDATTGICFPSQPELQQKWLESLGMQDFVPNPSSLVCLSHFSDVELFAGAPDLLHILGELPVPVNLPKTEKAAPSDDFEEKDEFLLKICRLCMGKNASKHIFESDEGDIEFYHMITSFVPFKISRNDHLSKWICQSCVSKLKDFYEFRELCIGMDKKQRENLKQSRKRKSKDVAKTAKKPCVDPPKIANEELLKVLEEQLPPELKSSDNIIIEVESDEGEEEVETEVVYSQEPVVQKIRLPKGITLSVNQTGIMCDAQAIQGPFQSEFCLVDGHVFVYRLTKGTLRQLKCLVPKCKATGEQIITCGQPEKKVLVKVSHSHPLLSEEERKKLMFLHEMHKKMQGNKTVNFRSVYEELCEKDPDIKTLIPLKTVINQICCQQLNQKFPPIASFDDFFDSIESDVFQKLHFTQGNVQFYQEKFHACDGAKAVVFANAATIEQLADSKLMYVDASFKIDAGDEFKYHLVSVLVWLKDSYYPIMFALINKKSQEIYKLVFTFLRDTLAASLRPEEIVTDYEASLYYSLGEVYLDSHIGGSVFYYTQNLYKKICALNLSRELETNSCFRNIYHMLLMLPLLPVNTILDGLNNIELQASEMGQSELTDRIFEHVKNEWMMRVTPELFCVHRLENRINENVIAPFKKLRDFLMLSKGKFYKQQTGIVSVVEKLIELESFLSSVYSAPSKRSFARDLSSSQKKNVIRAWHFIENHPKININHFFTKVLGYIKCMENQLWIWGFYRHVGDDSEELINAANFSIVNTNDDDHNYEQQYMHYIYPNEEVVYDVVINQKDGFLEEAPEEEAAQGQSSNEAFSTDFVE